MTMPESQREALIDCQSTVDRACDDAANLSLLAEDWDMDDLAGAAEDARHALKVLSRKITAALPSE
jgi:hypothetical protein